ncbi:MAG TPA: Asp-tRNA(Asn)/Glu-tRNA(Gln) amidotransferase subunit GatC [Candidatus Saccharimonadales bacterium]
MSKLSADQVLKLAHLSRLKLTDQEIERFAKELSEILAYVEMLNQADTDGLKPTYQVTGLRNVMRDDEAIDYHANPHGLLAGAPATEKNQYKVKRVIE